MFLVIIVASSSSDGRLFPVGSFSKKTGISTLFLMRRWWKYLVLKMTIMYVVLVDIDVPGSTLGRPLAATLGGSPLLRTIIRAWKTLLCLIVVAANVGTIPRMVLTRSTAIMRVSSASKMDGVELCIEYIFPTA